jgi:hypothetical protein
VLSLRINQLVKFFSCYNPACHLLPTLVEYCMYSHLPYSLYIVAMLCCSEYEEYDDEDFF